MPLIRAACEQQRAWAQAGLPPLRISASLSQRRFSQSSLVETVVRLLEETNAVPQLLGRPADARQIAALAASCATEARASTIKVFAL